MISKLATDSIRLDQKKPMQTEHHITQAQANNSEQVQLRSSNYTTRLRRDRVSTGDTYTFFDLFIYPYNSLFK